MSRAINLAATEAEVLDMCAKHSAEISAIETLLSGGTRVVLQNGIDAANIARAFGTKVMTGTVRRMPSRLLRNN